MSDPYFECPDCEARSYNPNDIREGYCGRCHWWTGLTNKRERDMLLRLQGKKRRKRR